MSASGEPSASGEVSAQLATTTNLTLLSNDDQRAAFGHDTQPPDTQFAAGPDHLAELVNTSGAFYGKSTNAQLLLFDLANTAIFPGPSDFRRPFSGP